MNFIDTSKIPLPEPEDILELYDKIRVCRHGVQIEKKPIDKLYDSYLDDHRLIIPDNFDADFSIKIYGLHQKPFGATMEEIVKLCNISDFQVEKVLVTTQFCNRNGQVTQNSKETYHPETGMYMAVTTIWGKK